MSENQDTAGAALINAKLLEAIAAQDLEAISSLFGEHADLLQRCAAQGQRPLMVAGLHGHHSVVQLLLQHGAKPDAFEACVCGLLDELNDHIEAGLVTLEDQSEEGWSLLHLACFADQPDCVNELLRRGASVASISGNAMANQPLHAALAGGASLSVVQTLVEGGADVNASAAGGITPLHLAASRGQLEQIRYLLDNGARPTTLPDGQTPADIADQRGHPKAAALLRPANS